MKAFITGALLIVAAALIPSIASAQQNPVKLGFVDFDVIIQQMPEFKQVESQLKDLQKQYEDTLKTIQSNFQEKLDAYQKQQSLMNPDTRAKEEANINAIREQFLQYQQDHFGQQGIFAQKQAQMLQPLRDKVRAAIEQVAKEQKLTAVVETGVVIYYDKKLEITYKVLDALNKAN
jgi:outer membrane protein